MTFAPAPPSPAPPGAPAHYSRPGEPFEALYLAGQAAAETREEQLAALAHDLRNPLHALAVSAEVLRRVAPTVPQVAGAVAIIGRQVAKLAALVDQHLPPRRGSAEAPQQVATAAAGVAVIDGDVDAASHLQRLLEHAGHRVHTASEAHDGLMLLLRETPALTLVAIDLPDLDGCDFARCARAAGFTGRLIALSSFGAGADPELSLAAGFEAHLLKPVPQGLLARLLPPR